MQISVITPCYNGAKYLRDTLESVARQQRVEFEHIVIDDCSTDESGDILREYEERLPHLTVIYLEENIGQSRARNAGLEVATGDYVAFLDSDDIYSNDTALYAWLKSAYSNDADLVRANYIRVIEETGDSKPAVSLLSDQDRENLDIQNAPELVNNTSCWLLLYKRSFLLENNITFSKLLRQREDRPFFTLALLHAKTVNLVKDHLITYRVHAESTMRNVTWEQLDLFATHLKIVADYMKEFASGDRRHDFRRANLLYYVKNIIGYWGPLLVQEDAVYREEFDRFFEATRELTWDIGPLKDDDVLDRINAARRESYFFDFAWFLLKRGDGPAFQTFLQRSTIPMECAAGLVEPLAGQSDQAWQIEQEIVFSYLRRMPPLVVARDNVPVEQLVEELPEIVLHAGMTKTGSSSLQVFFEQNRFELLRRHYVYYPFTGLEHGAGAREHRTSGHAGLVQNLLAGKSVALRKLALEIAALPSKVRTVVLSAENIVSERFWDHGDAPRWLAKALRGIDLKVVVYFRRQEDWLESSYVESVTSPGLRFEGTPMDFAVAQRRAGLLDFTSVDTAWRQSFPEAQLIYRSYEQVREKGDVIDDFLPLVGIEDGAAGCARPEGALRNESVPKAAAFLIGKLNQLSLPRTRVVELNARIVEIVKDAGAVDPSGADVAFYGEDDRTAIASLYDLGNRAFYNSYIGEVPAYRAEPGLKNWSEAGALPAALVDQFFDLFKAAAVESKQQGKKRGGAAKGAAGAHEKRKLGAPAASLARGEASLAAFSRRWRTRLRSAVDKTFQATLRQAQVIDEAGVFDASHYLAQAPSAAAFPGGPIMHFLQVGAAEGLDPSKDFNVTRYLALNSDVASANVNPLYHYVKYGEKEGRALG
jgi:capsular polysaccharide export protein